MKSRFIALFLSVATLVLCSVAATYVVFADGASSDILYGDANGDGVVDGKDLVRLKKYLANYDTSKGTSVISVSPGADCNGDGVIDAKDWVRLKKYFANYNYDTKKSTEILGPESAATDYWSPDIL